MAVLDYYGWHIGLTDFSACRQYRNLLSNLWDKKQTTRQPEEDDEYVAILLLVQYY
jgi:hypothetical protein